MGVIWVIESSQAQATSVAGVLMGDFAVRVFASFRSLKKLHSLAHMSLPDAIIVNVQSGAAEHNDLEQLLKQHYGDIPRAILVDDIEAPYGLKSGVWVYPRRLDSLQFSKFVRNLVQKSKSESGNLLRFKDLVFDVDHFHLLIEPGSEQQCVPPKEAKILKILMKSAGKPLSRQDISDSLWEGLKVSSRNLDSHISRLRRRLEGSESTIESIYGGGYVLK